MTEKILLAVDESENALKAVEYVGRIMKGLEKVEITLFHVLSEILPTYLIGEGVSYGIEIDAIQDELKEASEAQDRQIQKIMEKAKDVLIHAGIDPGKIEAKIVKKRMGIARDILEEAEKGEYKTIVVGRRGLSKAEQFLFGSISNKVISHAKDKAVWVVE